MAQTVQEKVFDYIACTQELLKKANEDRKANTKQAADIDGKIKFAVDALVSNARITEAQKKQAADMLKDPAKALELIAKVAAHRNADELGHLGTPVSSGQPKVKEAGFYDGKVSGIRESDEALFRGLGLSFND